MFRKAKTHSLVALAALAAVPFGIAIGADSAVSPEFHQSFVDAQGSYSPPPVPVLPPNQQSSQTAVDQFDKAVAALQSARTAIDAAWMQATDAQKGHMAGATISAERFIMGGVSATASQYGCTVPNKAATVPNYFAESADLQNEDTHLANITDAVTAARKCIAPDQQQSTASKVLHSRVVGIGTGLHTEFWGKGKRDQAKLQDQMLTRYALSILSDANTLAQYAPANAAPGANPQPALATASGSAAGPTPGFAVSPGPAPVTGTAGDFPSGPGLPLLHTSRTPDEGCQWVPAVLAQVRIALLVEQCTGKNASRSTETKGLAAPYSKGVTAEILVFTKPAAQSIEAAIRQHLASSLSPAARLACHAVLSKDQWPSSTWQQYDFTATIGPLARKENPSEIEDLPCSPWEDMDSAVKFLYRPSDTKTKFLFVGLGQEEPSWDVESIRFLPESLGDLDK